MTNPKNFSVFDDQERIEAPEVERASLAAASDGFLAALAREHGKGRVGTVTEPQTVTVRVTPRNSTNHMRSATGWWWA